MSRSSSIVCAALSILASDLRLTGAIQRPEVLKSEHSRGLLTAEADAEFVPRPAGPENFPRELQDTVKHVTSFLKSVPTGDASFLLMGDSTVRTMNNMILRAGNAVTLHVKNDRPSDQLAYPAFDDMYNLVEPGDEWQHPEYSNHPAVLRAVAASAEIRKQGCSWGGSLETLLVGAPMEGLVVHYWNFLPEYSTHGCWGKCMGDAVKLLQPRAMMWNIGMHMMNEHFDTDTCKKRHSHASSNCDNYEHLVTLGMRDLSAIVPTLVWRTTNSICDKTMMSFDAERREEMPKWIDPVQRLAQEDKCHRQCPFFAASDACYDWFAISETTARMHTTSLKVVKQYQDEQTFAKIHVLDAFDVTKSCCEKACPDTQDGMHYINGTDALLMQSFTKLVAEAETEGVISPSI